MSSQPEIDSCHYLKGLITVFPEDAAAFEQSGKGYERLNAEQLQRILDTEVDIETLTEIVEETPIYPVDEDPMRIVINLRSIRLAPIYAVGFEGHSGFMPGTPPIGVERQMDGETEEPTAGVICVVDSGIVDEKLRPPWMGDRFVDSEGIDIEHLGPQRASHGTFVTGLIRRIAPKYKVYIAKAGAVPADRFMRDPNQPPHRKIGVPNPTTEIEIRGAINRLIRRLGSKGRPKALNLSLGAYNCEGGEAHLQILKAALRKWTNRFHTPIDESYEQADLSEIFAAAGNSERKQTVYPAGWDQVRGVGAAECGSCAQVVWDHYHNVMPYPNPQRVWAHDTAPGSDLINLSGTLDSSGAPGIDLVQWSGSSFATAVASALYANNPRARDPSGVCWPDIEMNCGDVDGLSYVDAAGDPQIN